MQSGLSQPSPVVLSSTALHNFPAVQHQELAKAQSSLAFQQTSNTQPIPILYEHQLGQASGLGGSQLIDTHLLQVRKTLVPNMASEALELLPFFDVTKGN